MIKSFVAIIVLPLLFSINIASAASCKFADNVEDLFAGITIVRTKWDRISPNWEKAYEKYIGYVAASTEGEDTFLNVRIRHLEQAKFKPLKDELADILVVPAGTELQVIMADKTIVALPAAGLVEGEHEIFSPYSERYNSDTYVVITTADVKYSADAAAIAALSAQDATTMRMVTASGHHDIPIHKNSLDGIKNAVSCLSSTP
jgi:hypothetical protein